MSPGDKTARDLATVTNVDLRANNERGESDVVAALSAARNRFQTNRLPLQLTPLRVLTKAQILPGAGMAGANALANQNNQAPNAPTVASVALPGGWEVLWQVDESNGHIQWAVYPGRMYDTKKNGGTLLNVTGCLAVDSPIDPTDAAWSDIPATPTKIWIEGFYDTGWPVLSVAPYISTTDFDGKELEYDTDGGSPPKFYQTYWRRLLGEVLGFNADATTPKLITGKIGTFYLTNGGDDALLSDATTPKFVPIIFPRA